MNEYRKDAIKKKISIANRKEEDRLLLESNRRMSQETNAMYHFSQTLKSPTSNGLSSPTGRGTSAFAFTHS